MTDKTISGLPALATLTSTDSVPAQTASLTGHFTIGTLVAFLAASSALVPATRQINTTAPLQGGGDLSVDRTLSLANSGVTAATYGSATQVGQFTVDALGRLTAAANVAISVPPTGAAGGDLTGTYPNPTLNVNVVTNAKFRQSAALSVVGRGSNSLGDVADIATAADGDVLRRAGVVLSFGKISNLSLTANTVNDASLRQGAALSVIGRSANSLGNVADIAGTADQVLVVNTAGTLLSFSQVATAGLVNNAVDNTKFRQGVARSVVGVAGNATANVADLQGTADQVLRVNGAGNALAFGTVDTGGLTANAVTNAKLAQMAQATVKGRASGAGTGDPTDLTAAQLATILGALNGLLQPGDILINGGTALRTGCLWPAGQNVSRTTYALLFAVYSTTFGVGDGSTTFGLPDLRGRYPVGRDDMNGSAANRITNAIAGFVGTTLGASGGSQSLTSHNHNNTTGNTSIITANAAGTLAISGAQAYSSENITATGAGASQNVPPALVMNYMIYAGV